MKLIHSLSVLSLFALGLASPLPLTAAPVEEAVFTGPRPGALLGYGVAVSGDTAVVGASAAGGTQSGDNQPGAAHVYVRSGGTWTQQAVLTGSNPAVLNWFGNAVAIDGNTIVVGAPGETGETGAAYVFTRSGTTWTQQARLKASNPHGGAAFGSAVAISGNTVAVGSAFPRAKIGFASLGGWGGENGSATGVDGNESDLTAGASGAVYVFERQGARWHMQAYVKASNTGANDNFGSAVALSGDTLVVGASGEDSGASGVNGNQADNSVGQAGAAYVFTRVNDAWSQQAYLKPDAPTFMQGFGISATIDGDTVVVGSYGAYVPQTVAGAHVFTRNPAGVWSQQAALTPLGEAGAFGISVSLSHDTLVVGEDAPQPFYRGVAHVFRRNFAGAWSRETVFTSPTSTWGGGFGIAVAIDGDALIVGSGGDDNSSAGENKVWMYGGAGLPDLAAEQPAGTALPSGGTKTLGILPGTSTDIVFTLRNTGPHSLNLTGTPDRVAVSGSSDFTVTAQPAATVGALGSTTFTVRFAPATAGLKTATLSIPSDDPDESPYVINLSGRGLSATTDTDSDGMNDAAEFNLAALGFDWQTSQPALVNAYFANANNNGLYTTSQVQALNVGTPLLTKNPATGKFTLTIGIKKTTNLALPFSDFPMTGPGTSAIINGAGKLEFEFPSSDNAAFFRLQSQ